MADGKMQDVCSPREGKDGKTHWHKVGRAWTGAKGTTVFFDSLPLPDKDGKVAVMLFEQREKTDGGRQPATGKASMDDEIPF